MSPDGPESAEERYNKLVAAIRDADIGVMAFEGVSLLYWMSKDTEEYQILAEILGRDE